MDGVHDMGGTDGFGRVEPETNEPVFHAPWEGRVFGMTRSMLYGGAWSLDELRAEQEKLPPHVYLSVSYYERWTLGLERLLTSHGFVEDAELQAGETLSPGKALGRKLTKEAVTHVLRRASFARPAPDEPRFRVGDVVRTRNIHPLSATRLPRYARDKTGRIERVQGCHVFPDSVVLGKGDDPQWLYTVVFEGRTLWGEDADPSLKVSIEAFEPYLEAYHE